MCFVFFGRARGHLFGAAFPSAPMLAWPSDLEQSLRQLVIKTLPGFRRRDASAAFARALSEGVNTDHGPSLWDAHGEGQRWVNITDEAPLWFCEDIFFFSEEIGFELKVVTNRYLARKD